MAPKTCKTPQMRDRAGKAHPRQRAVVSSTAALWSGQRRRLRHWDTGLHNLLRVGNSLVEPRTTSCRKLYLRVTGCGALFKEPAHM